MPIPFIVAVAGVVAAVGGAAGAGAYLSAKDKREEAESLYKSKSEQQEEYGEKLELAQQKTQEKAEFLGELKLQVQANELNTFVDLYQRLGKLNISDYLNEDFDFSFSPEQIRSMKKVSMNAKEVLGAGVSSLTSGALAGAGVYSSVMAFGAASTGAAISGLSGVAATNATLAWLGGGALKAGGMGVAGGSMALGLWVAGPALLVAGIIADNKAEKALTEAKEFAADVDIACEKMESETALLGAISVRCEEFSVVINELRGRLNPALEGLSRTITDIERSEQDPTEAQLTSIHKALLLSKAMKDVLNITLVGDDGQLSEESHNVQKYLKA